MQAIAEQSLDHLEGVASEQNIDTCLLQVSKIDQRQNDLNERVNVINEEQQRLAQLFEARRAPSMPEPEPLGKGGIFRHEIAAQRSLLSLTGRQLMPSIAEPCSTCRQPQYPELSKTDWRMKSTRMLPRSKSRSPSSRSNLKDSSETAALSSLCVDQTYREELSRHESTAYANQLARMRANVQSGRRTPSSLLMSQPADKSITSGSEISRQISRPVLPKSQAAIPCVYHRGAKTARASLGNASVLSAIESQLSLHSKLMMN